MPQRKQLYPNLEKEIHRLIRDDNETSVRQRKRETSREEVILGALSSGTLGLLIPLLMRPAHGTCIPRAPPSFSFPFYTFIHPRRSSFALVLKYLGFMNAAAGCINYTTLFRATERRKDPLPPGILYNVPPAFPPPAPTENTADKTHKLC